MLGPYKIERYAKLPQRSKTVTTGLGSIKTTWIRVYSASNRLLGLENGWPFRRFGGGAAPPPSPLSPLGALSHISHSLTDALPGCPRTSAIIKARLIDINRQRGHATVDAATAQNGRETTSGGRKSAAASGGAQRHQQAQPPPNPEPCELCRGVLGVPPAARRTCDQRAPVGACGRGQAGGQQTVRCSRWPGGSAPTSRAAGRSAATRIRARHRPGGRAHGAATAPGERRLLSWPPECPPRCAGWR